MRCVSDITDSRFSAMNAQNDSMAEECTDVTLSSATDPSEAKDSRADVLESQLNEAWNKTTRTNSQFPRPDLHRQDKQLYGLRADLLNPKS
jgi:hypothetical protein